MPSATMTERVTYNADNGEVIARQYYEYADGEWEKEKVTGLMSDADLAWSNGDANTIIVGLYYIPDYRVAQFDDDPIEKDGYQVDDYKDGNSTFRTLEDLSLIHI